MPASAVGDQLLVFFARREDTHPMRRYVVPALSELAIVGLFFAAGIVLIALLK
jgi:hypothetical protein